MLLCCVVYLDGMVLHCCVLMCVFLCCSVAVVVVVGVVVVSGMCNRLFTLSRAWWCVLLLCCVLSHGVVCGACSDVVLFVLFVLCCVCCIVM